MMQEIEEIAKTLPQIDCGSCGAPTCMAFAEDVVKGETTADECTVILRMLFHDQLEKYKEKINLKGLDNDKKDGPGENSRPE